jgi:hypothetical protein
MKQVNFIFILLLSSTIEINAQIITNHESLFISNIERPKVGVVFTDPVFGTPIRRLTNAEASGWPGCVPQYSKRQAWNADDSRMILTVDDGYFGLFDGNNYSFIKKLGVSGEDVFWHPTDTDKIIFWVDNSISSYTVSTDEITVIHEFPEYEWGNTRGEGNLSNDGRYYAFVGQLYNYDTGEVTMKDIVIYDFQTNSVLSKTSLPEKLNSFDWASISSLGNYVVIDYADEETGRYHGVEVYDRNMNFIWQKPLGYGHSDLCADADGEEVLVMDGYDPDQNVDFISKYRLSDGKETELLRGNCITGHVTCRNLEPRGWCLISSFDFVDKLTDDILNWVPFENEIYWLKLDGSGDVKRIAHHHSRRFSPGTPDPDQSNYWAEPHATVNKKGTKVIWGSNWEMNMDKDWAVDTYLADVSNFFPHSDTTNIVMPGKLNIRIYPNPANVLLYIQSDFNQANTSDTKVFNIFGNEMYSCNLNSTIKVINITDFPEGIYFIRFNNGRNSQIRKFVVQH